MHVLFISNKLHITLVNVHKYITNITHIHTHSEKRKKERERERERELWFQIKHFIYHFKNKKKSADFHEKVKFRSIFLKVAQNIIFDVKNTPMMFVLRKNMFFQLYPIQNHEQWTSTFRKFCSINTPSFRKFHKFLDSGTVIESKSGQKSWYGGVGRLVNPEKWVLRWKVALRTTPLHKKQSFLTFRCFFRKKSEFNRTADF